MAYEDRYREIARLYAVNLKRLRKMRNMSQLALACEADMDVSVINNIENRKCNVTALTLSRLSKALQVEPYQFLLPERLVEEPPVAAFVEDFNECVKSKLEQLVNEYRRKPEKGEGEEEDT